MHIKSAEKGEEKAGIAVNVYKLSKYAVFFAKIPCFSKSDVVEYG